MVCMKYRISQCLRIPCVAMQTVFVALNFADAHMHTHTRGALKHRKIAHSFRNEKKLRHFIWVSFCDITSFFFGCLTSIKKLEAANWVQERLQGEWNTNESEMKMQQQVNSKRRMCKQRTLLRTLLWILNVRAFAVSLYPYSSLSHSRSLFPSIYSLHHPPPAPAPKENPFNVIIYCIYRYCMPLCVCGTDDNHITFRPSLIGNPI